MRRPCYVVDSFAAHPLAGNPAGVVLDGADLDAKTMQRIANELKHSETAFPLPAREPTAALHLRWFTPEAEVAFCGHATLATFHVLVEEARRIRVPEGRLTRMAFTCKGGRLNVELSRADGRLSVVIETPASRFEAVQIPAELAPALGIVPEALPRWLVFTQGDEMGRPGRIEVEVRQEPVPSAARAFIGGNAVTILRGELEL